MSALLPQPGGGGTQSRLSQSPCSLEFSKPRRARRAWTVGFGFVELIPLAGVARLRLEHDEPRACGPARDWRLEAHRSMRSDDASRSKPEVRSKSPVAKSGRSSPERWLQPEYFRGDVRVSVVTAQERRNALSGAPGDCPYGVPLVGRRGEPADTAHRVTRLRSDHALVEVAHRVHEHAGDDVASNLRSCVGRPLARIPRPQRDERLRDLSWQSVGQPGRSRVGHSRLSSSTPSGIEALEGRRGCGEDPAGNYPQSTRGRW